MNNLTDKESLRYSRHLLLEQISESGQLKLKSSHVVIVGAGGLGCPAALYLAAAGVGHLTIIDPDTIELSNLQRQVIYKTNHIGRDKAQLASQQLQALNTEIKIDAQTVKVEESNFKLLIANATAVLDCTDNAASRYFINQACVEQQVPLITAAAIRGEGQLMVFNFKQQKTPCYHCVFPDLAAQDAGLNCSNSGVLGPLLGIMGSMQALECVKLITQPTKVMFNKLLTFDAWEMSFMQFSLTSDEQCSICRG
ncbi:HesA/MoeB/ThiF family protein [Catenovulum sediminis]|uniref:HesA/MoeB/ThiF family protein n=1 Tax=Catenovulum sediminis TaxID=1740262 RepID=UPI00117CB86E|nr:HesA/MoeB/ThiF family protein [Catenovulum sediminis]